MSYQNEDQENFEMDTVCNTLKYHVNLFGFKVNIFVLALVIGVVVGLVFYTQQQQAQPSSMPSELSATSLSGGLASIYRQMGGGFSVTTPDFIKRLN